MAPGGGREGGKKEGKGGEVNDTTLLQTYVSPPLFCLQLQCNIRYSQASISCVICVTVFVMYIMQGNNLHMYVQVQYTGYTRRISKKYCFYLLITSRITAIFRYHIPLHRTSLEMVSLRSLRFVRSAIDMDLGL